MLSIVCKSSLLLSCLKDAKSATSSLLFRSGTPTTSEDLCWPATGWTRDWRQKRGDWLILHSIRGFQYVRRTYLRLTNATMSTPLPSEHLHRIGMTMAKVQIVGTSWWEEAQRFFVYVAMASFHSRRQFAIVQMQNIWSDTKRRADVIQLFHYLCFCLLCQYQANLPSRLLMLHNRTLKIEKFLGDSHKNANDDGSSKTLWRRRGRCEYYSDQFDEIYRCKNALLVVNR